ncbi:phosphatidylserine decarboxylase [Vibrio astriarenae]|nr:phosphatidylserine decarboxylase [Vibrio sp. C7]
MNRLEIKKSLCVTVATISLLTLPYSMEVFASEPAQYTGRDKAAYDLAYSTGVQAVVYGWTPVMMDVALKLQTSVSQPMSNGQAPINEFGPITRLWDYRDRSYTTPNNDTIYLQLWGDLEEQPYVLTVPPIRDRYWIAQIIDMYTESVVDLGNATVGEVGGDFVLAKRGYEGELPEGLPVFYSDTRYIWIAGRLGASSSQDEKQALELQSMFRFTPLSKYPETLAQPVPKLATNAPTVQFPQGLAWFEKLNDVLEANPLPEDAALVDTFKYIGIGSEGVKSLDDVRKEALKKAFKRWLRYHS